MDTTIAARPGRDNIESERNHHHVAQHEKSGDSVEEQIAECAERIVAVLVRIRQANILQLSEHLTDRSTLIYQAIGWLAREGRISYERHGNQVYVLLRSGSSDRPAEERAE
jgi:hypothetical protein